MRAQEKKAQVVEEALADVSFPRVKAGICPACPYAEGSRDEPGHEPSASVQEPPD